MTTNEVHSLGELLRRYRLAAGLSQEALAERAGLSVRGISDLERGVRTAPHATTVGRLAEALGLDPSARMVLIRARQSRSNASEPEEPPPRASAPLATSLTSLSSLSSFVGREKELVEIRDRLDSARLLTLVGPGGVGKTRLAFEVARVTAATQSSAVFVAELAPLTVANSVAGTVAAAVGAPDVSGRSLIESLAEVIGSRRTLLVLDNCEHVVGAAAELAEHLLRMCEWLTVLATSREPLGIGGEVLWRVPSLAIPLPGDERVTDVESVRLFIARAQAALPGFDVTPENGPAVGEVCRRLDGIPLAIELAAARVRALQVTEIASHLDDVFRLLVGGSRTALPRQRTLAATMDWSYELLHGTEQALLRRLAVFAGGWALEAAEAVAAGSPVDRADVLDLMAGLVDRSLVQAELNDRAGQARYHLLETVRQYARVRLEEAGEANQTQDRHVEWITQWAEATVPRLVGSDQVQWLQRITLEHDNFRAALDWTRVQHQAEAELRLTAALGRFWHLRGASREGRFWLTHALESNPPVASRARAIVLNWAGRLATVNGDIEDRRLLEESVSVAREIGDRPTLALALRHLSMATRWQGDDDATWRALEAALEAAREANDRREEAFALVSLGATAEQDGNPEAATRMLSEGLKIAVEVGDVGPIGWSLTVLGAIALKDGHLERAEGLLEEAVAVARPMGYWGVVIAALAQLVSLAQARGNYGAARARGLQCIAEAQAAGDRGLVGAALATFADLELQSGHYERGTRLLAAESAWRSGPGARRAVSFWTWPAPTADAARAQLGEAAFTRAWTRGQLMTLEQAAHDALAEGDSVLE